MIITFLYLLVWVRLPVILFATDWVSLIFESSDLDIEWDGTCRSQEQEVETYLVNIRGVNKYGESINKTITLALLR